MLIIESESNIITNCYQKTTSKGRMINFYSKHSYKIKLNTSKGFLNWIIEVSDECFWNEKSYTLKKYT